MAKHSYFGDTTKTSIATKPKQKASTTTQKKTKAPEGQGEVGEAMKGVAKKMGQKKKGASAPVVHHRSNLGLQNANYRGSGMGLGRSSGLATRRRQGTK